MPHGESNPASLIHPAAGRVKVSARYWGGVPGFGAVRLCKQSNATSQIPSRAAGCASFDPRCQRAGDGARRTRKVRKVRTPKRAKNLPPYRTNMLSPTVPLLHADCLPAISYRPLSPWKGHNRSYYVPSQIGGRFASRAGGRRPKLQPVEGLDDRARPLAARGAARAEPLERGAGGFELGDAGGEGGEALARQLADAGAVVGAVERQQLADLLERDLRRSPAPLPDRLRVAGFVRDLGKAAVLCSVASA
jgi:hypothetical protein